MERFRTIERKDNIVEIDTNKNTYKIEYSCEDHAIAAMEYWKTLEGDLDDIIGQMWRFVDEEWKGETNV